jgi:hypothetical protein
VLRLLPESRFQSELKIHTNDRDSSEVYRIYSHRHRRAPDMISEWYRICSHRDRQCPGMIMDRYREVLRMDLRLRRTHRCRHRRRTLMHMPHNHPNRIISMEDNRFHNS